MVALLGGETLPLDVVQISYPTKIALVTNGVWRCEAELERLSHARTQEDVRQVVARCASETRDDATAVVFEVN